MRIGLTYDLRHEYLAAGYSEEETAEFDRPDTIDALERALDELGYRTHRIGNARQLIQRLAAGDTWDLVFNIAEGLAGIAREAQVPAILDVYGIPYTFSDPLIMSLTLHKAMTKSLIQGAGLPTAPFAVIQRPEEIRPLNGGFPFFAKPLAEGTGKGISPKSKITTMAELDAVCRELLQRYRQPVLLETYLPGREFTVGLIGTGDAAEVLGTLEIVLRADAEPGAYSYVNKERCEDLVEYRLVSGQRDLEVRQAEATALRAWQTLGCRDAGRVDLRSDQDALPHFLEVNPLAGLHPQHSDLPILCNQLDIPYNRLIDRIVHSASQRVGERRAAPVRDTSPVSLLS